jgi:protoporphyrinogen oxidase
MKIAVVGGGLAGMCAAMDLSAAGHSVSLYEKYPNFGGLASAFDVAGTKLERFYHHVFSTDLDLLYLMDELGLQSSMRWSKDDNGNFYGGKTYPNSPAWRILTFSPLSILDRLRLAFAAKYLSLLKDHRPFESVTAQDWITRRMGAHVWKVFWEPLFHAKFGRHAPDISMTWFFGRIKARFGPSKKGAPTGHLGYLMGSTQVMVDALRKRLEQGGVRLLPSHGVRKICAEAGKVTGLESKDGFEAYDQVLVTCATPLLLEMAAGILPEPLKADLEKFIYHGSVIAVLELKQSLSPYYWLTILDSSLPFLAVIEQTRMIPPENYQGRHIMYLAKYLDTSEPFYSLGNEAILEEYYAQLKKVFPNFDPAMVIKAHVMKADYTQPIVTLGYGARIPPHRLPVEGLYLANMTQIYPEDRGMSYSIGMGRKVAKQMLEENLEKA